MILAAVLWLTAGVMAVALWSWARGIGWKRLIIAMGLISLLATAAATAYVWIETDRKAALAEQRLGDARTAVQVATATDDLARAAAGADRAFRDFHGTGLAGSNYEDPGARTAAAEVELAQARAELANQTTGIAAAAPVLTWGAALYLLVLVLIGSVIWVSAVSTRSRRKARLRAARPSGASSPSAHRSGRDLGTSAARGAPSNNQMGGSPCRASRATSVPRC